MIEEMTLPREIIMQKGLPHVNERIEKRLQEIAPAGYEVVMIDRENGSPLRFFGKLLAEAKSRPREGRWSEWRLWQTLTSAYIAETVACSDRDNEDDFIKATVIRQGLLLGDDPLAVKIMDAFEWRSHPRRMLLDALGWTFPPQWID